MLDDQKKERLREISQHLSVLGPTFMNNVTKSAEQFEMLIENESDLSGLPESAISGARHAAEEKGHEGKWLFTLEFPSFGPFIQYADKRELREKIWRAFSSRAYGDDYDNCDTILKIVRLRDERAKLIGYQNHAEYVLERRMAESADTVMAFLEKLKNAYKPGAEKELKELQDFAKEKDGLDDLKPWDVGYYAEKLKQERFHFSSEDLRPYFPLENVLNGCFTHFSQLFGLSFTANENYPAWHKDVTAYDVTEEKLAALSAHFTPTSIRVPVKKTVPGRQAIATRGCSTAKSNVPLLPLSATSQNRPRTRRPSSRTAKSRPCSMKWAMRSMRCCPM